MSRFATLNQFSGLETHIKFVNLRCGSNRQSQWDTVKFSAFSRIHVRFIQQKLGQVGLTDRS